MATVRINDGAYAWLADLRTLISALDAAGWEKTRANGGLGRIEPDEDAYTALCASVPALEGDADEADEGFVRLADQEGVWVWA